MVTIVVFSYENDLHAHAVIQELGGRPNVQAHFVSVDTVVKNGGVSWSSDAPRQGILKAYSGAWIRPCEVDLVWWRRMNQPLAFPDWLTDAGEQDFLTQEWRGAVAGAFFDGFRGVWVNHPSNDSRAANKLYQLTLAKEAGLRVPRTLISQQPSEVRQFCRELGCQIVAKKIVGSTLRPTVSVVVGLDDLGDDEAISLCPAIYQEIVRSQRHLRVNCFGDSIHTTLIESEVFDWRRNLNVPFVPYSLDSAVELKLCRLLRLAGLRMGIMDMILDPHDEPIWLELNPQGQFLFCEALSNHELTGPFADFLIAQAADAANRERSLCDGTPSSSAVSAGPCP